MSIGIYFGTTTGNTEAAAEVIKEKLTAHPSHLIDVVNIEPEDLLTHDLLFLGIPTWNVGDLQYDWEDLLPKLNGLDLTGKKIAMFGLGDSYGYPDNFLDALGIVWEELKTLGKPELLGVWPTEGYTFEESRGLYDQDHFLGLGLDEENEAHLHDARITSWLTQVLKEAGLS